MGNMNIFLPGDRPVLSVELPIQLLLGYLGVCTRNRQPDRAAALLSQLLPALPQALRDLHPLHSVAVNAAVHDAAMGVAYAAPGTPGAESWFQEGSRSYLSLGHTNRLARCCLRFACVLHRQGHYHEAEHFCVEAVDRLNANGPSSLLAVAFLNRAVLAALQRRGTEAEIHLKTASAVLRHLPPLKTDFVQAFENAAWLISKIKELVPSA